MKKVMLIFTIFLLAGCSVGGNVSAGGGSNGVGIGFGLGTGIRF